MKVKSLKFYKHCLSFNSIHLVVAGLSILKLIGISWFQSFFCKVIVEGVYLGKKKEFYGITYHQMSHKNADLTKQAMD